MITYGQALCLPWADIKPAHTPAPTPTSTPAPTPARTPATADSHSRAIIALTAGGAKMFPALRCAQIVTKYTPPPA